MALEHATHTTLKITRFDSEEWLNYNKKERSKHLKNEPNCLKPEQRRQKKFYIFLFTKAKRRCTVWSVGSSGCCFRKPITN